MSITITNTITIPTDNEVALLATSEMLRKIAQLSTETTTETTTGTPPPPAETTTEATPPAETTTEVPPPAETPDPLTDSRGVTWNAEIHAGSKTLLQDGSWRRRRGVSADTVAQVEASVQEVPEPPVQEVPEPPVQEVPEPPVQEVSEPPVQEVSEAPTTLAGLLQRVNSRIVAKTLTMSDVNEACITVGVKNLQDLGTKPDKIPAMWKLL